MSIDWQRVLPVLVSIGIIIAVAILRQYSRTFAAVAATMPINVSLAIWIVSSGDTDTKANVMQFIETLLVTLPSAFAFLIVAWLMARAGWGTLPMIVVGYLAWGVALLVIFWLRGGLTR